MYLLKVLLLEFDLFHNGLKLLLEGVNFLLLDWDQALVKDVVGQLLLVALGLVLLIGVLD